MIVAVVWLLASASFWMLALYGWVTMSSGGFSWFVCGVLALSLLVVFTIGVAMLRRALQHRLGRDVYGSEGTP